MIERGVLVRVSLALVATGIVSAASLRTALSDVGPDLPFAVAVLSFLVLLLLAAPARPPRWATPLAFALAAAVPLRLLVRRPAAEAAVVALALATFAFAGAALVLGKGYHVDAVTAPHRAAELLLRGEDPYRTFDLPQALAEFGLDPQLVTHYADGSVMHVYNYPALSFLVVAPFVASALDDIRWIYLAALVALVLAPQGTVREPWRPFVVALVIASSLVLRQGVLAGVDPTWGVLAAIAWLFIDARRLSPILLGLAVADRQTAWLLVPFYLRAVWSACGRSEASRRAAIALVVALVPNVPFLVDAPAAFVASVLAPLGDLPADGVGLVRFALAGSLPQLPRAVWSALSAVSLAALAVVFWRYRRSSPQAGPVFAVVPLSLGWRSRQNSL